MPPPVVVDVARWRRLAGGAALGWLIGSIGNVTHHVFPHVPVWIIWCWVIGGPVVAGLWIIYRGGDE